MFLNINNFFFDLKLILPELFLFVLINILLLYSLCLNKLKIDKINVNSYLSVFGLFIELLLLFNSNLLNFSIFNNSYKSLSIYIFIKIILVCCVILCLLISIRYFFFENLFLYEYIILILFSLLGMFFLLCSNDFLSMFLSLELQSFSLYILAAYKKNKINSVEAGLKYYILGGVSTCFLLFGCSIIYGFSGLYDFDDLYVYFLDFDSLLLFNNPFLIGFILIIISFLLKLGAAPFHIWVPDVYEGIPTILTLFFSIVPKFIIFFFLVKLYYFVFLKFFYFWHVVLILSIVLSLFIGIFGALYQIKIKRLLAYSGISHVGFLLIGLLSNNYFFEGLVASFFYLLVYFSIIFSIFIIVLLLRVKENKLKIKNILDFKSLLFSNYFLGIVFIFNLFSLAGIPPLAGFFSKFYIFISGLNLNFYLLILYTLVLSSIGAFYYIRLIKYVFFRENFIKKFYVDVIFYEAYILSIFTLFNILFFIYPKFLLEFIYVEILEYKLDIIYYIL